MSLVGPKSVVDEELREYQDKASDLFLFKPGITGYWQASGRSEVGYLKCVDIELDYVYNRTLYLDIKILLKTVVQVIFRRGAY